MKVFEKYQKMIPLIVGYDNLAKYGVTAPNPLQKYLCNISNRIGFWVFLSGIIFAGGFIAFEAQTLQEYSDNSYIVLALTNATITYLAMKWKSVTTFQSFGKIQKIIENREHSFLYFPIEICATM